MKHILMIERNGIRQVNPHFCPHEHTVIIKTGHVFTFAGEHADDEDTYSQCLDCGWVMRDDRTWGMGLKVEDEKEIPF
jgi:hypothetical protein